MRPTTPYFTEAVSRKYAANWVRLGRATLPRAVIGNGPLKYGRTLILPRPLILSAAKDPVKRTGAAPRHSEKRSRKRGRTLTRRISRGVFLCGEMLRYNFRRLRTTLVLSMTPPRTGFRTVFVRGRTPPPLPRPLRRGRARGTGGAVLNQSPPQFLIFNF